MATTPMIDEGQGQSLAKRFFQFIVHALGNSQSIKFLEIASAILLLLITGATAYILLDQGPQSEPLSPAASATMLVANLLPATLLLVLFGRRIALRRAVGSNIDSQQLLHVRLVAIFSAITAVPTLLSGRLCVVAFPKRRTILVFRFCARHAGECRRTGQGIL
jgi:hypothetical protein